MKVKFGQSLVFECLNYIQKTAPKGVASDKAGTKTTWDKGLNPNRSEKSRWFPPDTTTITTKTKRKWIFVSSCDLVMASEDAVVQVIRCSIAMWIVPPINSHIQSWSLIEKGQRSTISKHTSLSSKGWPEQQAGQVPSLYSVQSPSRTQQTLFSSIYHLSPH